MALQKITSFTRFGVFFLLIISPLVLFGQVSIPDNNILDTIIIVGEKKDFLSLQNGGTKLDMRIMGLMPTVLGNADPVHYLQYLPGIQMNNEYDSGLHIQGCDNSHNMVSVEGVPIYNAGHLLGFFSIFNTSHFKSIQLNTHPSSSLSPNRVGGEVDMKLIDKIPDVINGDISIGPISSQGSIKAPLSNNSSIFLSGRLSYLNLLYSHWLDIDGSMVKYDFGDLNLTYLHRINNNNTLLIDGYYGVDKGNINDSYYGLRLSLEWGNKMLSAHLSTEISNSLKIDQKLFISHYENCMTFASDYIKLLIPSGITTYGYTANIDYKHLTMGVNAYYHNIDLQSPAVSNYYQNTSILSSQQSQEISAYVEHVIPLKSFLIEYGVRGSIFHDGDVDTHFSADPSVSFSFESTNYWNIKFTGYQRHQFLAQTGISSMGLPFEFWLSSTEPQMVRGLSLRLRKFLKNRFSLSLEMFYKKLYNQIEYIGDLLDYKETNYNLSNYLYPSIGENYGISINLNKRTGKIVGWINYTYTHARRSIDHPMFNQDFPPSHERPHELDIVATYKLNNRWNWGATFVFASGTAFTAPSSFYFNNGNIVSQYGDYNGNRLPCYLRLDFSTNYYFKNTNNCMSGLNFSLYNALNSSNPLFYRLKLYENEYGYKKLSFVMKIMPSISFFYKF